MRTRNARPYIPGVPTCDIGVGIDSIQCRGGHGPSGFVTMDCVYTEGCAYVDAQCAPYIPGTRPYILWH